MGWIDAARAVVLDKQAYRIDVTTGHLVPNGRKRRGRVALLDLFSAQVMVATYDALSAENQASYGKMNVLTAQSLAMRLAQKCHANGGV